MRLEHEFSVPMPADKAWELLLDIERVAPCMPGATLESVEGDKVTGNVKVKVGPITVTYKGTATFEEKDESARRIVLSAAGKEARGSGTARAKVTSTLAEKDDGTLVTVISDLTITGRPAQFGRGVMADVGDRILGQFAACLSDRLAGGTGPAEQAAETGAAKVAGEKPGATEKVGLAAEDTAAASGAEQRPEVAPIDLVQTAGLPVLKRAAGPLAVVALAILLFIVFRRRR